VAASCTVAAALVAGTCIVPLLRSGGIGGEQGTEGVLRGAEVCQGVPASPLTGRSVTLVKSSVTLLRRRKNPPLDSAGSLDLNVDRIIPCRPPRG
jgi:hypothetical protein